MSSARATMWARSAAAAASTSSADNWSSSASRPAAQRRRAKLTHQQIAQRAQAIWKAKGCPTGQDEKNWLEAETQLKAEMGVR